VGVVVHTGTAESGHYYSYIREQQNEEEKDKWFEFNDAWVSDFDPATIPSECFGGEETGFTNVFNNSQHKMQKFRNAYICVYKRRLQDDVEFSDEEDAPKKEEDKVEQKLGATSFDTSNGGNALITSINADNHMYWQNRFLFGSEYTSFVYDLVTHWNTVDCIATTHSERNNDWHLLEPFLRDNQQEATQPPAIEAPGD
jgi:hypothetical protein